MIARLLKALVVIAVASVVLPAFAHEVSCEKTVGVVAPSNDGGFSFVGAPAATGTIDHYPAQVGFRIRVTNLAPEPSVLTGTWDSLDLSGATVLGDALDGASIPVGGTLERLVVVSVPSYEACLALGGEPDHLACHPDALENRFVATHDAGSAECRARLLCLPERQPPPVCVAPQWTGQRPIPFPTSVTYAWGVSVGQAGQVDVAGWSAPAFTPPSTPLGYVTSFDATFSSAQIFRFDGSGDALRLDAAGNLDLAVHDQAGTGYVRQFDAAGTLLWQWTIPEPISGPYFSNHWPLDVGVDAASNVYVAYQAVLPGGDSDVGLAKLTSTGALVWARHLGTDATDIPGRIAVAPSGDLFVSGTTMGAFPGNTAAGAHDAFLAHLDTDGNTVWIRQLGTPAEDFGWGAAVDSSGRIALAGSTAGALDGGAPPAVNDAFVAVFDAAGTLQWIRELVAGPFLPYVPVGMSTAYAVAFDAAGAVWVAGNVGGAFPGATAVGLGQSDGFLARLDPAGTYLWARQFGGGGRADTLSDVVVDCAGYGVAPGNVFTSLSLRDAFVVRVAPDGSY